MTNGNIDQLSPDQHRPLSPEAAAAVIKLFHKALNERNKISGRRPNTSLSLAAVYAAGGMRITPPEGARVLTTEEVDAGLDYLNNPTVVLTPDQERRVDALVNQGLDYTTAIARVTK